MDLLPALMAVGFTEYESKVYLALLTENPATGYQLSKKAGIPRSMVYEALGRLNARGAVLRAGDRRATLFRPVPPDVLLDRYEQEHRILIHDLRDGLHQLYSTQEEDRYWTVAGRSSVLAYAMQMIDSAQSELLLVLNDPELEILREKIQHACARRITVSVLLTGNGELDCGEVGRHPPLESELQELTHMLVVVVDGNECMIASTAFETTATVTNNRNLVLIARQFVWMELFAQRVNKRLGTEMLSLLEPGDRRIFEGFAP